MEKPFRLYQLPSVAIAEVFKQFERFELIDLAQCSKKSAHVVHVVAYSRCKLILDYRTKYVEFENFKFYAWSLPPPRDDAIHTRTFGFHTVPVLDEDTRMVTYWQDWKRGLQILVTFLAKLFSVEVNQFFSDAEDIYRFQTFIEHLLDNQTQIERLNINVARITEARLSQILTNIKVTEELWITSELPISSSFQFPAFPKMLRLDRSSWFTLDHFLAAASACVRIALVDSQLSNNDLDGFIGKWKSGEYLNLECLDITGRQLGGGSTIAGFTPPIVDINNARTETKLFGTYYATTITNTVDIHRDTDGIRASIHMNSTQIPSRFQMIVWN